MGTLKLIIELIPMILALIKSIEEMIPAPGKGQQKREFAVGIISEGISSALPDSTVGRLVDSGVGLMNAVSWGKPVA